ncbi:hypothetical protein SAMN05444161_7832 [Rhizobiales bacterium GAS191]|nr:hypothetical protein SAMN05519103_07124 [Rhizobiales bacterium GAS113]SEE91777.1 hypothetical protein SAMN05444161_7832 [Rhizobiales bacterium GAS191]
MDSGRILLMRHAEKPADPTDPNLSPAGKQRAAQLANYIPSVFGKPDFLFASAISKRSRRPLETLEPLSTAIGVAIDTDFADQDYSALAHELWSNAKYNGKLIVICWHHGNIPSLADALRAKAGDYPDPWNPLVFNLILQFDIAQGASTVTQVTEPF